MSDYYTDRHGAVYSPDRKTLVLGPLDCAEYFIPEGTEVIGEGAFCHRMSRLGAASKIHIPQSVKVIKKHAFERCSAVITSDLPSVEVIEEEAFWQANGIEELHCPNLRTLGDHAFIHSNIRRVDLGCNLKDVGINPFAATPIDKIICSSPNYSVMDDSFFIRKTEQTELITRLPDVQYADIPGSIDIVKENAFSFLSNLKGLSVDAKLIDPSAISGCPNLHLVIFGQSVRVIGDGNLSECPKLHTVAFDHYFDYPLMGEDVFDSRGIPKKVYVHDDADFILSRYPRVKKSLELFTDINARFYEPSIQFQIGQTIERNAPLPNTYMSPMEYSDAHNLMMWDRECAKAWYSLAQFGRHPNRDALARLQMMENEKCDYTCDNSSTLEA
jgi:hypothetical protein